MPYLKVPNYRETGESDFRFATVEEVQAALPEGIDATVDMDLNYPCVQFPKGTAYETVKAVEKALNEAGFEAYI